MPKKFNESEYKIKYAKEHYTRMVFDLKKEEAEKFKANLKLENVSISEFFKKCVKNYKEILKNY